MGVSNAFFDAVISDLSPQLTGIRFRDAARSSELVAFTIGLAEQVLRGRGTIVVKIFPGEEAEHIAQELRKQTKKFSRHVLKATRGSSKEMYFVAQGFVGSKNFKERRCSSRL